MGLFFVTKSTIKKQNRQLRRMPCFFDEDGYNKKKRKERGIQIMLEKGKKVILSVLLAVMMLSTYLVASAAEPSEKVVEGGKHSVYAFGKSVVFIVGDTIEIVPNNDTKMIDVMIDGKVFKGLKRLELKTTEGNKVVPEEGSIILECDSQEQAQELMDKIATGMENNTPVSSIEDLVGEQENISAFIIDESGNLVDDNGNAVTGNDTPKVEINSVSNVSEEFQEEQQELREEMKQQEERERQAAEEASKVDEVIVPPASESPTTESPKTESPKTESPKTESPATESPATESPATA